MLGQQGTVQHIVCGDEAWFHVWDPDSRCNNHEWVCSAQGEKRPKVVHREQNITKVMLVIFFDQNGVVYHEFVPNGVGINRARYLQIMRNLRERMRRIRPGPFRANSWAILHDGAPTHRADPVVHFVQNNHTQLLPHLPYSPDLNPPDFWLFSQLKSKVRG